MCPACAAGASRTIKKGFFTGKAGHRAKVQRFLCKACGKMFSSQTHDLSYRAKKPHIDQCLFRLHASGVSERRCARILGVHRTTIARKIWRLGEFAEARRRAANRSMPVGPVVVFDEMETSEHTKMKPISIAVAVEKGTRRIIAVHASSMPAKGRLAAKALRKYGTRADRRRRGLEDLLQEVRAASPNLSHVESDQCPRYPQAVRQHLPGVAHRQFKGRRACTVGQGELKAGGRDPLFSLNHTCAMIRDNLKTLSRRTWCTTKVIERLQRRLDLYAWYHNETLGKHTRLASV